MLEYTPITLKKAMLKYIYITLLIAISLEFKEHITKRYTIDKK
jgi:hypothetical protein